jgi:hypothetical protein
MNKKLSSVQMILDIASMRKQAMKLLDEDREYRHLLKIITAKDYFYDEDLHIPSVKELAQLSGLAYDKVRKQVRDIYTDLVLHESAKTFDVVDLEYWFYVKGYKNRLSFTVNTLPVIPRVGEQIRMPYFKAYLDTDYFFVEEVWHKMEDQKQIIEIKIAEGWYNLYWHFRLDQAVEEGEVNLEDKYTMKDYELKRILQIGRYKKNW